MIELDTRIREKNLGSRMLMQVHDELVVDVPDEEIETMRALVKDVMEGVVDFAVPILVDIGVGKDWRSAKK